MRSSRVKPLPTKSGADSRRGVEGGDEGASWFAAATDNRGSGWGGRDGAEVAVLPAGTLNHFARDAPAARSDGALEVAATASQPIDVAWSTSASW
jgi:hypothetical protein